MERLPIIGDKMSIEVTQKGNQDYAYFYPGREGKLYLGNVTDRKNPIIKKENILKALDYLKKKNIHYADIESQLLSFLPQPEKYRYISKQLTQLDDKLDVTLKQLSESEQKEYLQRRAAALQTSLRRLEPEIQDKEITKAEKIKARVVVFGLSTEGYALACQMAIKGADVFIIDESDHVAFSLKPEIAKTYPDIVSLKGDEPLLGFQAIDITISRSDYIFFAPRIRKTGEGMKTEIKNKFEDAISSVKKGATVIYCLPTELSGNVKNIQLLENITGLKVGKDLSYCYYPLGPLLMPSSIGAITKPEIKITKLLSTRGEVITYVPIEQEEFTQLFWSIRRFPIIRNILEILNPDLGPILESYRFFDIREIYLDDMTHGISEIRLLNDSLPRLSDGKTTEILSLLNISPSNISKQTLISIVDYFLKQIDYYQEYLIQEILNVMKQNNQKAEETKVSLVWTLDSNEIRVDKSDVLDSLVKKIRDNIRNLKELEIRQGSGSFRMGSNKGGPYFDLSTVDKTTIIVACSRSDFEKIQSSKTSNEVILPPKISHDIEFKSQSTRKSGKRKPLVN